jgi:hypothetical protein
MPGLKRVALSVMLALVLGGMVVTAWGCLIAGLVWMVAGMTGPGPALLWVGGGLVVLVALSLGLATVAAGRDRGGKTGTDAAGLLRGVVMVAGLPAGPRLLLASASVFFALLAALALLLATRRTGKATPDRQPPR